MKKAVTLYCYARQEGPGLWVALCLNLIWLPKEDLTRPRRGWMP